MHIIKKIFSGFSIVSLLLFAQIGFSQVPDELLESFRTGNSKTMSEYFNQNVDLVILGSDNVCSKAQAQQIVAKFFSDNTPESFTIVHQGGREGDQYVIGNLKSGTGSYRVYFLLKTTDGKNYIHQLRIDKQ